MTYPHTLHPSQLRTALTFLLGATILVLASPALAQDSDSVRTEVDEMPQLLPDMQTGLRAMQQSIRYPESAKEADAEGRVFVAFIVDEEGNVTDPEVTKGAHEALNAEAVRVTQELEFRPGRDGGEPVKVKMTMPFTFKLPTDSTGTPTDSTGSQPGQ